MILCLGDSITAEPGGWPSQLGVPVEVRAVTGAKVCDVFAQVRADDGAAACVVSVGSNDSLAIGAPIDAGRFADLVRLLGERAERVALLDVLLFWPTYPGLREQRDAVRAAVQAAGCDVIRPVLPPWCWRRDRIHPNGRGQVRIARAVTGWLEAEKVVP